MALLRDERGSREHWRLNEEYLRSHAGASQEWNDFIRDQVQFLDPPAHARQRKLVSKAFTPRAIEARRPQVQQMVDELLAAAETDGEIELIAALARPLPFRVICELLGLPWDADVDPSWMTAIVRGLSTIVTDEDMDAASRALAHVTAFVEAVIDDRRRQPADDLLTALIQAEEQGDRLSDHELLSLVVNLFVGGSETTMNLIGSGVYSLLCHPVQLRLLRDEPDRLQTAVEELLRFESPAQFQSRTTLEPIEVAGVDIPAGETLFLCLGSANRDEARWDRPDELDITRNDLQHVAFGYGIHHCLGASLARLEASVAIGTVVRRYPDLALATDDVAWGGAAALTQRGLKQLRLTLYGS
jgi:cytochrome P450